MSDYALICYGRHNAGRFALVIVFGLAAFVGATQITQGGDGPLVVLDVKRAVEGSPDYGVSVADIEAWERRHGPLPPGAFVVAKTGWEGRRKEPARYVNRDEKCVLHFPVFSSNAAEYLSRRKDIRGVGIDTQSTDPGRCTRAASRRRSSRRIR